MSEPDFKQIQQSFTDAIRADVQGEIEGIEQRRLGVYRELFYNNVESFISGTFPVLQECLDDQTWQKMVRLFFKQHECDSPYFLEISEEFLQFLAEADISALGLPDFAYQLAHWEWMELFADAYVAEQGDELTSIDLDADIITTIECAWLQAYEFPVHTIEAGIEVGPQPAFLLVYRNQSETVKFIELNPLSFLLFQSLQANESQTITQVVKGISEANSLEFEQLISGAKEIIANWSDLQLIKKR